MKNQKLKVLFFSAFYPPFRGGAEVFVEEVGKRLARTHEVTVLTARLSRSLPRDEVVYGMHIVRVGVGAAFDKYLYPFLALWYAFRIPHDVVYGVLESYAGIAVALYKIFTRRPAILNIQSGTLDDWKRGWGLNMLVRRWMHRAPDAIHAISQHLARRARKLGAKNVVVIPNGIDLATYAVMVLRDPQKIICVGRLYQVKGQDVLLGAMPLVLKEFPQVKLHLVGDGPEREKLKVESLMLKVDGSIIFRGDLLHDEIPKEMAGAAIVVGPSRREGQGIVFVEAMAAGTPVVASRVGGIPEVVEDGVTGLLVPPENPAKLAEAICKLLHDSTYARQLVENARKHVARYDWRNITVEVEQLIFQHSTQEG